MAVIGNGSIIPTTGVPGYVNLAQMQYWIQTVIPLVYDDSISSLETLGKVLDYINTMISNENAMEQQITVNMADISALKQDVATLQEQIQKFINGEYTDLYLQSLINWIDQNIQLLVGRVVKYVFFGLSPDGYFMAYIPESWQFIKFDTILNYQDNLYGHLVLNW